MLTRLKVTGFKNLIDVDVRFGPFTCIAGANGVGKSNLLDAISFLSALADLTLAEAALSVRDAGRSGDIRSLFHRTGDHYDSEMSLEAEMIVPKQGLDDLGQTAEAAITFLRYSVALGYRDSDGSGPLGGLELLREELSHIKIGDAPGELAFKHSSRWRNSVVIGRRGAHFISTDGTGDGRKIKVHQDSHGQGRPRELSASTLPRTALSVATAAESPTATLARLEMRSWRLLRLEPSSLREPDPFTAPAHLQANGAHLPATLYRLAKQNGAASEEQKAAHREQIYCQAANKLSELIDDVKDVRIDHDEKREILTLIVTGRDGTSYPARALSDGTLRFLALTVLELDPEFSGLVCLEEPENGIHPKRIPAMLDLLQDLVTDTDEPVGPSNPLRQVIVNTHSPAVVSQVLEESLLSAELTETVRDGRRFKHLVFRCLPGTWREKFCPLIMLGKLIEYLNPIESPDKPVFGRQDELSPKLRGRRVADRPDLNYELFG